MNLTDNLKRAQETVEIFQMWGMSHEEALNVSRSMTKIIEAIQPELWKNPLKGTGLKLQDDVNPRKDSHGKGN